VAGSLLMPFLTVVVSYFFQLLKRAIRKLWTYLSCTFDLDSSYREPFLSRSSLSPQHRRDCL